MMECPTLSTNILMEVLNQLFLIRGLTSAPMRYRYLSRWSLHCQGMVLAWRGRFESMFAKSVYPPAESVYDGVLFSFSNDFYIELLK